MTRMMLKYVRFYRFVKDDESEMADINNIIFEKGISLEERATDGETRYAQVGTPSISREYLCQFNNSLDGIRGIKFGIVKVGNNEMAKRDGTFERLVLDDENKGLAHSTHMVLFEKDIIGVLLHGASPRVGTFLKYMDVKFDDYFSSSNIKTQQIIDKESIRALLKRDKKLEGFKARISPKEFLALFPDEKAQMYQDNFEKEVIVEIRVKLRSKPQDPNLAQLFVGGLYELISDEVDLDKAQVDLSNSAYRDELLKHSVYKVEFNPDTVSSDNVNNNDTYWYNRIRKSFEDNKDGIIDGFCVAEEQSDSPDESESNI